MLLEIVGPLDKFKSTDLLYNIIGEVVDKVDINYMVQIIMDNDATNQATSRIVIETYPHITWTPYVAHCLGLMLEDLSKISKLNEIIENARIVSQLLYNLGATMGFLQKYLNSAQIIRPKITHFATHFIALESIVKHKSALTQLVTDEYENFSYTYEMLLHKLYVLHWLGIPHFSTHFIALESIVKHKSALIQLVIDEEYLGNLLMCKPLIKILKLVNFDARLTMTYLYHTLDRAKFSIKEVAREHRYGKSVYQAFRKIINR